VTPDPDFKVTIFFDIVTVERQQEVVCALSNGDIINNLVELGFQRLGIFFKLNISKTVHLTDRVTIDQ